MQTRFVVEKKEWERDLKRRDKLVCALQTQLAQRDEALRGCQKKMATLQSVLQTLVSSSSVLAEDVVFA
jgi:hypothetical protein